MRSATQAAQLLARLISKRNEQFWPSSTNRVSALGELRREREPRRAGRCAPAQTRTPPERHMGRALPSRALVLAALNRRSDIVSISPTAHATVRDSEKPVYAWMELQLDGGEALHLRGWRLTRRLCGFLSANTFRHRISWPSRRDLGEAEHQDSKLGPSAASIKSCSYGPSLPIATPSMRK
jgi:hypothetical protein